MSLNYTCPRCGTPLGYEGLCWKCKCEQERNAALAWTPEQVTEKQENLVQNIRRLSDFQDPECTDFWQLLSYRDAITPEIQRAALADEGDPYHDAVTFFTRFHRDEVPPDVAAELFPGTDPAKLSFAEMADFLRLKRFGSLVDSEIDQQVFILDLSFNPEITDELMVVYIDLNKEIFCITHEN